MQSCSSPALLLLLWASYWGSSTPRTSTPPSGTAWTWTRSSATSVSVTTTSSVCWTREAARPMDLNSNGFCLKLYRQIVPNAPRNKSKVVRKPSVTSSKTTLRPMTRLLQNLTLPVLSKHAILNFSPEFET
ncbi:hypothetical protein B566_EDAN001100 [Ephemera danica]|nr:hypothetical protein B566_EDAN001100 [Ephemera danica]